MRSGDIAAKDSTLGPEVHISYHCEVKHNQNTEKDNQFLKHSKQIVEILLSANQQTTCSLGQLSKYEAEEGAHRQLTNIAADVSVVYCI